jgi:recombination protein RecR
MKRSLEKFNRLVECLEALPSIGKKSAVRLAYFMVMEDNFSAMQIAHAIENAVGTLKRCSVCGAMSEDELCAVCSDESRDKEVLCIVESAKDILMFEENGLFLGRYFVLDALEKLDVQKLETIVQSGVKEIVFALTPSIQNDSVMLYIEDRLASHDLRFTKIAQGVPTGVSLENIDILSLSRALADRVKV